MKMKLLAALFLAGACAVSVFAQDVKAELIDVKPLKATKEFKVLKAAYGVKGKSNDVTVAVQNMVKAKKEIAANNNLPGGDPAEGKSKKLEIVYSVNGKIKVVTVPEFGKIAADKLK